MSLTLNSQMIRLFNSGLEIVKTHQQQILLEWENVLTHLQGGEKSTKNVEDTISFFADYLFANEDDETDDYQLNAITPKPVSLQTNQFIITLLENAVHKVIQKKENHSYHDHQAVQYLFSTIGDDILKQPFHQYFTIDSFIKNLVSSNQLPIEWAAITIKKEQSHTVEKWFNNLSQDLLLGSDELKADTIYSLTELLLNQMPENSKAKYNVMTIPYEDLTLLVCVNHHDTSHIMPFITYALQTFQYGKDTFKENKQEQQWKDSVIMFNETIMRSRTYNEAVENITAGFVNYLPFERCALFSYSVNDQMGFGLFGHRLDNKAIQNITEDISNLPLIQNNLRILELFGKSMSYLQPIYMEDATLGFPDQYVQQFGLNSVVVAPIYVSSSSKLLGAAILDQGRGKHFKVAQETFSALTKFGQSAGEILSKHQTDQHDDKQHRGDLHLSPREIEVLKLMAKGASTIEAASNLNLSEYTVRDYISAIIQKMDTKNRTESVAKAIREGLI
ncbi:LuxR C-terminal-related transcriptional regulator [Virgibacillus litoralis]|uniref:DNA-binding CsgD family transcriptional regulator n=1 Tax=Virgibacillus litoralis TaxID=578221 RepID=A0ABS4HB22_9BACI|nr:LuxR C-terminal-related transcriptional regulator [Virgibacillus litoralis]MBP1948083.1 DNA-binding CsgD family transcriptional regulator [Virgibacillus litoralis]